MGKKRKVEEEPLIGWVKQSKRRNKLCWSYKLNAGHSYTGCVVSVGTVEALAVLRIQVFGFPWTVSSWPLLPVSAQRRRLSASFWIISEWWSLHFISLYLWSSRKGSSLGATCSLGREVFGSLQWSQARVLQSHACFWLILRFLIIFYLLFFLLWLGLLV